MIESNDGTGRSNDGDNEFMPYQTDVSRRTGDSMHAVLLTYSSISISQSILSDILSCSLDTRKSMHSWKYCAQTVASSCVLTLQLASSSWCENALTSPG